MNETKNKQIAQTLKATREKRKAQDCFVRKIKIQESSLKKIQKEALKMQFVEAKWIQNEAIASEDIFNYKPSKIVKRKDKDGNVIQTELSFLGSQAKQSVIEELKSNIKTLSTLKKKGKKVGKIRFKSEVNSINLKQFGTTYSFKNKKLKIQNVPGYIRVNGLNQILTRNGELKYELANAKLINTPNGYYLCLTCFKPKERRKTTKDTIGIDMGVSTHITLSDGTKINASVRESERLKKLQRKFSKQTKGSKRRYKNLVLIKKEYQKMTNKKIDLANKICHGILQYENIYMQDENLSSWKIRFGKQIHHSVLGRVKARLIKDAIVLSKWKPTTKMCNDCGTLNDIKLSERTYKCKCGYKNDRDIHAAQNMIKIGQELPE